VAQTKTPSPIPKPSGRLIDLGEYKLHLDCRGKGSPTAVLSPGAGDFSFDWALVQPEVAKFTRVCSYDRSGEAWSDLGPKPRTAHQEVYDLHRLLAAAGEPGPYVVVGQSLGGMIARIFAAQYPKETAGLVLVDSFQEDSQVGINGKLVRIRTLAKERPIPAPRQGVTAADSLDRDEIKKIEDFIAQSVGKPKIGPPFDRLPPDAKRDRIWALSQPKHYAEGENYMAEEAAQLYGETARIKYPLGGLPLIVLTRSLDEYPPDVAPVLSKEHQEQQVRLAQLSSVGKQIVVPNCGHHIHLDAPDAVVSAIKEMVSVRRVSAN
jgi:pimeloyl-ACP methyl ester carboxylesterase